MDFQFDGNQDYQLRAIQAVIDLWHGQPCIESAFERIENVMAICNRLDLTADDLLENLQHIQSENKIPVDEALSVLTRTFKGSTGNASEVSFYNFSIEMETGTGKTYVYLRTLLELYQRYGLRKFIVVVPTVAVREGVLKTLQITQGHLKGLYKNLPYHYYVYDADNLSRLRQFSLSESVEIMIMTIDAFNKKLNVIHQDTEKLQGEIPIHLIQAVRPIVILDEPQTKMGTDKSIEALATLNPLMTLRYSATHRERHNLIYRLTPYEAYQQGLVKQVEIASVLRDSEANLAFIKVEKIETKKRTVTARLTILDQAANGRPKAKSVTVKWGDKLGEKSQLLQYQAYEVDEISVHQRIVRFTNGKYVEEGAMIGGDTESLHEVQIHSAIEEHFRKQRYLKDAGIKVLTLFFIDRVVNYTGDGQSEGRIRAWFTKAFDDLKTHYPEWEIFTANQVQKAYFAQQKKKGEDAYIFVDTQGQSEKDADAYNLIMKDKERLLSFDEPTAFIFSHSALNEGWDNPNIFQICTLREVGSDIARRQQIGRGVRLAVNQSGQRIHDKRVNILTVIANESYELFVQNYQHELNQDYEHEEIAPPLANARQRQKITLQEKYFQLNPDFQELWERIKHKTRYNVHFDTSQVIQDVVTALEVEPIPIPKVTITKASLVVEEDHFEAAQTSGSRIAQQLHRHVSLPQLIHRLDHLLRYTNVSTYLTRASMMEIITQTSRLAEAAANPQGFATIVVRLIKEHLAKHLIKGIQYERINEWYEMSLFETEIESWLDHITPAQQSPYDYIICDSGIEKQFVEDLNKRQDVLLFIKLPPWFIVPTPIGNYNPDWAIVMKDPQHQEKKLYLVRETKGEGELRPSEKYKTDCGERHFKDALGISYRVVTRASDLP